MDNAADIVVPIEDQTIRDRAIRLFTFLRELTELRSKVLRSVDQYDKVLWLSEIPREQGCHCVAWPTDQELAESDVWLEIKKPRLKSPPKVPRDLEPWLDPQQVEDSSREFPDLRERIVIHKTTEEPATGEDQEETVYENLLDSPEVKGLWEQYVQDHWWPWAEEDRRLQTVQRAYTDLFSIYQKQQRLGEAYEVVLGSGYLTWNPQASYQVKRHLVVAQTSLSFDAPRGVISLGPAGEGPKPVLEQDMLEPQDRPNPETLQAIERQTEAIGDALWDGVQVQTALKAWVHAASPHGNFDDTLVRQGEVSASPRVHFAPAILLRKRTERSLLRVFQDIVTQLREGQPLPIGVKRLVTIMDDSAAALGAPERSTEGSLEVRQVQEIYFPLPANDEQLEIVEKLSARRGVLVQGPPGTGKSHTIVNLVCHLLATGQRVLITSHTSRALRAILEKFKGETSLKPIADLCVILLGDDLDAMQALEDSVNGITEQYKNWNADRNRRLIIELERKLAEARQAEAQTLAELRAIREAETYRHPSRFGGYTGTAQQIAVRLRDEQDLYAWLPSQPREEEDPPLSDSEALELLQNLREIDDRLEQEAARTLVETGTQPSPQEFSHLVLSEATARARYEGTTDSRAHLNYLPLSSAPAELRRELAEELSSLLRTYDALSHSIHQWVKDMALHILADRDRAWRELLTYTKQVVTNIGQRASRAASWQIEGLHDRNVSEVKAHASALLAHLEGGGRLGFGPLRPRVVKEGLYLVTEVRVNGRLCNDTLPLGQLVEWLSIRERMNLLATRWAPYTQPPAGPWPAQIAEYLDLCEPLERALELHDKTVRAKQLVSSLAGFGEPQWHNPSEIHMLHDVITAISAEEELRGARAPLESLERTLTHRASDPKAHPVLEQLVTAIRSRDERVYLQAYQRLQELWQTRDRLTRRRELLGRLQASCPSLLPQLTSSLADPAWEGRFASFTAAWNWARADQWLKKLCDPTAHEHALKLLDHQRTRVRDLIRDLAAAKAWRHCLTRLTESQRQHLEAWSQAVRRVGKGTGKYANQHRKAARDHMEQCRSAIPAWIMPIYRIAETIRPGVESFNVVIIDEASQSGPEAIFLQYLAEKIVVVGDDKQISPDFIGIQREDVDLLRQRHLRDIPHNDALGLDTSFFDQAVIRFGGRIRLCEHFRCMPEIIQFSNSLCYRSEPLIPLRQYGAGRLWPVIVTHHVPGGFLKGHSPRVLNEPEAHALVGQIKKCCEDQAYKDKSMGVISLLGEDQAKLIERLLLDKIGPEEIEKRNLVCGDAYAFQGTERDIMFLSLVSAPTEGRRIGTLSSARDERRFNVAASRARDQMWLFHTATLSDLSPNCLRYRLLEYCLNPSVQHSTIANLRVDDLKILAKAGNRGRELPPSPFESWFEIDVCLAILDRGYRVTPQFEIAGRRIDLLVEGMRGRLAVECDGDEWHGAERYEQDQARERMLMRCGMNFWRVRGSSFYRDPGSALESLWDTLDAHGISPAGQEGKKSSVRPLQTDSGDPLGNLASPFTRAGPPGAPAGTHPPFVSAGEKDDRGGPLAKKRRLSQDDSDEVRNLSTQPGTVPQQACLLTPYQRWTARPLPDPRSASIDDVLSGLVEIISAEGPMPCHLAYSTYAKAAGIQRVGREIRSILNRAVRKAVRSGLVDERDEHRSNDQMNKIVRRKGSPAILARVRAGRIFDEIPPAEIGMVMKFLLDSNPTMTDDELFQAILAEYQFGRLTVNIRTALEKIKLRLPELL